MCRLKAIERLVMLLFRLRFFRSEAQNDYNNFHFHHNQNKKEKNNKYKTHDELVK